MNNVMKNARIRVLEQEITSINKVADMIHNPNFSLERKEMVMNALVRLKADRELKIKNIKDQK